jgi:hypothetical protein
MIPYISNKNRVLSAWVTGVLFLSAVLYLGFQLWLGLGIDDVGRFETTLAMSISSQFTAGPEHLYGPYTATHHLVLIHAPLYYRLAALLAWPLVELSNPPLTASIIAGRLISLSATFLCLLTAYRLSRLDGAPNQDGLWAACLIAAAPIPGLLAVMVRPDMLAVALQTVGVFLVLRSIVNDFNRTCDLFYAYVLFAIAFCVKQHSLIPLAVSSALLVVECVKGRAQLQAIVAAHLAALGVALLYLGVEEYLTDGRMSLSVFVLPGGQFRQINHASWEHVGDVFLTIVKKLGGLLAMIMGCAIGLRLATRGGRLDLLIALYLSAELVSLVPLCLYNKGSADNYALQSVVFASILVGRAVQRILNDARLPAWRLALIVVAPLLLLTRDVQFVKIAATSQTTEHAIITAVVTQSEISNIANNQIYFVDRINLNRMYGSKELIHDEWLYGAFEKVGIAEPRSRWLRSALVTGTIRYVVMPDETTKVPGLDELLPGLGFAKVDRVGCYHVWKRG